MNAHLEGSSRALVTGAGGFVGRRLVERLVQRGVAVRALARNDVLPLGVETLRGDARDTDVMRRAVEGVEHVFHLAGKAHDNNEPVFSHEQSDISVGTALALTSALQNTPAVRVVFVSSLAVYGSPGTTAYDEDSACGPSSSYGSGKLLAERALLSWGRTVGAHVVCLRPSLVYGPGCKGNLDRLLRLCVSGWLPPLPKVPVGRVMVHVDDLADACLLAAEDDAAAGRVFNVTDGELYTAADIVDATLRELGRASLQPRLPLSLLRAGARSLDLVERLSARRMPFSSSSFEKLFGPAVFSAARLRELGWRPRYRLWDALPGMLAALNAS